MTQRFRIHLGLSMAAFIVGCSSSSGANAPRGPGGSSSPPSSSLSERNPRGEVSPAEEVALSFDVPLEGGGSKTLHTAYLDAVVDGRSTRLIVDSGASDHVFVRQVLPFAETELREDSPGTDHAGAPVTTWRVRRPIEMQVGTRRHTLPDAIVILGPPPFEQWDIGGFVAPQLLATEGVVVLDLKQRTLTHVEVAPKKCPSGRSPLVLPIVPQGGDGRRLPVVNAKWNGADVRLLLNTGGREVEISPEFADAAGEEMTTGKGVSGEAVKGRRAQAGVLQLQDARMPVASPVVRDQGAFADAQVGIAFLSGAILAFPAENAGAVSLCLQRTP